MHHRISFFPYLNVCPIKSFGLNLGITEGFYIAIGPAGQSEGAG